MHGRSERRRSSGRSSRSTLKMRFSPRPTSSSMRGLKRSSCRQISEPMLPPAPVTITRAAFDQLADDVHVQLHRGPAQKVADLDVADGDAVVAAQAVLDAADDLQFQPGFLAGVHQVPQPRAGQGARRDQHVGRLAGGGDFANVFQPAEDRGSAPAASRPRRLPWPAARGCGRATRRDDWIWWRSMPGGVVGAHQQGPAVTRPD